MKWLPIKEFAEAVGRSVPGIHLLISNKDPRIEYMRPGHEFLISSDSVAGLKRRKNGKAAPRKPPRRKVLTRARTSKAR